MPSLVRVAGSLGVLLAVAVAAACGTEGDSKFGEGASSGNGGSSGGETFGSSGGGLTDGGGGGSSGGDAASCASSIDMYVMFDRSGSMGDDCDLGSSRTSKWCRAINSLSKYLGSQGANGNAAALQFFPFEQDKDDPSCQTGAGYDVAALPTSGQYTSLPSTAFNQLLDDTEPSSLGDTSGTPTEAAIRGMTKFTSANRRGGKSTIGILITDGNPNGCNESTTHLAGLLDAHYKATKIRTYVIGMQGADFGNLEEIAAGGGTPSHAATVGSIKNACGTNRDGDPLPGPCHFWNVGSGDGTAFEEALKLIQESADGCRDGGAYINPVN